MSNKTKTISINPAVFKINHAVSKKRKEKTQSNATSHLISPNLLKNKLLKRIKEHKIKENQLNTVSNQDKPLKELENDTYADEFTDSINYLNTLSEQQKIKEAANYRNQRKEELERKMQLF